MKSVLWILTTSLLQILFQALLFNSLGSGRAGENMLVCTAHGGDGGLRVEVGGLEVLPALSRGTSAVEYEASILRTTHQEREGPSWSLRSLLA